MQPTPAPRAAFDPLMARVEREFKHARALIGCRFDCSGRFLFVSSEDDTVQRYDLLTGDQSRLTVLGDFNQANNNRAGFAGGTEWAMNKLGGSNFGVALRGSYTYQPANNITVNQETALNDEESLQGLAFGGGLMYATEGINLGFDYAYKYLGILGATNFFTLSVGW